MQVRADGLLFPVPRSQIRDATEFRSTWLTASQQTLRHRGLFARYETYLPPSRREEILGLVAGVWLPMSVARDHYTACDALELDTQTLYEIGRDSTRRVNQTILSLVARLSRGAGATPWTVLSHSQKLWERTCSGGGAIGVFPLGPKEARIEVVGYPLAGLKYNRVTFRGIVGGIAEMFCEKLYVVEIPKLCSGRELGFKLSWV
jgi:hypothetical protein